MRVPRLRAEHPAPRPRTARAVLAAALALAVTGAWAVAREPAGTTSSLPGSAPPVALVPAGPGGTDGPGDGPPPPAAPAQAVTVDELAGAVTWVMVDVSSGGQQGDAHLLIGARGDTVLVDAGTAQAAAERLVPYLVAAGITRLDRVFVSHAHDDHYGGLVTLLDAGVELGEVHFPVPAPEVCDAEASWGCDMAHVEATVDRLRGAGVAVSDPPVGTGVDLAPGRLEVLYGFDGLVTPIGRTDVNDTSVIMRLDVGDVSVLFTGDLNEPLGRWLADQDLGLAPTRLLKVPHHGAERLAPDELFAAVAPAHAFVPAPLEVWCSQRAERPRTWFEDAAVPVHVSGDHGHVTVTLSAHGIAVDHERPGQGCPTG